MRLMPRNKACQSPTRCIFFDCETTHKQIDGFDKGIENIFRLGVAIYVKLEKGEVVTREVFKFNNTTDFWRWVDAKATSKTRTYVFAHNIAFDLTVADFWNRLDVGDYSLFDPDKISNNVLSPDEEHKGWRGVFVREDPPTIIGVKSRNKASIMFCDTLNWFRSSLAVLGNQLGFDKLEMPDFDSSDEDWYVYCERDVEIIERTMCDYIRWIIEEDLGNFRLTAPSQAFGAFNHRFRKPNIVLHLDPEVCKLERSAYYGGRLESFYIGEIGPENLEARMWYETLKDYQERIKTSGVYYVDVNSLYPAVMRELSYPVELEKYVRFDRPVEVDEVTLSWRCIADVHLDTQIPMPKRIKGVGFCFVTGKFRTQLAGPELERAYKSDIITHVYSISRYKCRPIFTEFVDYFYAERMKAKSENNESKQLFCKLLMNSLYGKFGQMTPQWEPIGRAVEGEEWGTELIIRAQTGELINIQSVAGMRYMQVEKKDHKNSFCAIAAYVTSYARERMQEIIDIADAGNVYYIVTDGLMLNRTGYDRLKEAGEIDRRELGKLSLETHSQTGWIGGIHWYEVGEKIKKGSNKKKSVVLSSGYALQEKWERLAGILNRGPTNTVRVTPQIKHYSKQYKRGVVCENGHVIPLLLDEPLEF